MRLTQSINRSIPLINRLLLIVFAVVLDISCNFPFPIHASDLMTPIQEKTDPAHKEKMRAIQTEPGLNKIMIALSDEEKAWLKEHPVIRVFKDPGWPPIEFTDAKGQTQGITADYLTIIEQRLGIRFEQIFGLTWQEGYERLKRWEIDMTPSVAETPERKAFWTFTKPYMTIPIVIVTPMDVTYVSSLRELKGKKIAVVDGYAVMEWIPRDYPDMQLVKVPTTTVGLELLQRGEVFAVIDNMLVVGYYLAKMKIANLKIAGEAPYVNAQCMAVRKDWPILTQILQKAIDSISNAERDLIYQKWVPIRYEHGFDYRLLWQILVIFIVIVAGLVVWNRKLTREIRSRKKAEAALVQSEERLRLALEGATDGIWDWNLDTDRMYFSPRCAAMLGYLSREYPTSYEEWRQLLHPDDKDRVLKAFQQAILSQTPFAFEFRLKDKTGQWRWILVRGKVAEQKMDGKPVRVTGSQTHITKRKQAEESLRRSEEQLALAIEGSGVGLWDWRIQTGEFVCNERVGQILGYKLEELTPISKETRILLTHPEDLEKSVALCNQHLKGKTPDYECEIRLKHKKGHWVWILDRGKVVEWDSEGKPLRMTGTYLDITERKHLEAQFLQAQKMESVGRLAGGVAHDFNNMLAVIIGNTELAMDMIDPAQSLYVHLEEINKAGQRSSDLTRQLLAFARKQTIMPRVMDLNDTVAGMIKLLRRLVGEDIDLSWMPGANLWPVKIDPAQLDQILANLCINARDAIEGVGKVSIETRNITVDLDFYADHIEFVPGDYVRVTVTDDGSGMDKEVLEHLFEPFFTTKALGKGTGLGLATVYGIVHQNDGFVTVLSKPDQGTTFNIFLPRYTGLLSTENMEEAQEMPLGQGQTVLLVEDEIPVLTLGQQLLQKLGYTVLSAHKSSQALSLSQTHAGRIDLLITDVVMPEMNGRDLAERIKTLNPRARLLYMSGYTSDIIAHRGVLDQGVLFIQKPFSKYDLALKVSEALKFPDES